MGNLNSVRLIGRLGADPETRYTASGEAVCSLRVGTTESWRDKASGEKREATEWHRVVVFGKPGEYAGQYAKKGREVFIDGKLKTRKWQDKDGNDRYTTEIQVSDYHGFQLLGAKPAGEAPSPRSAGGGGNSPDGGPPHDFGGDNEIPFVKADIGQPIMTRRQRHPR